LFLDYVLTSSFFPRIIDMTMAATENIKAVKNIKPKEKDEGTVVVIP
jgi:hypothetical protein